MLAEKQVEQITQRREIEPSGPQARMASLGSLKGTLVLDDEWDSPETNEAIAKGFEAGGVSSAAGQDGGSPDSHTQPHQQHR